MSSSAKVRCLCFSKLLRHLSEIKVTDRYRAFPPSRVSLVDEDEEAALGPDVVEPLDAKAKQE